MASTQLSLEQQRWQSVINRDKAANGQFVYAVKTTGIFCLPSCPSRQAKPENVVFFDTADQASAAGYRACKTCRPENTDERYIDKITLACKLIENSETVPKLADLAAQVGLSRYHFHRIFKRIIGLTPKVYASAIQAKKLRIAMKQHDRITDAIYEAGFSSDSRFYEKSASLLGMQADSYRKGGKGTTIYFALGQCIFGEILVAQSAVGVCAVYLGDDPEHLLNQLQQQFAKATLIGADKSFEQVVAHIVGLIENPFQTQRLPLDIQGTAFQEQVWRALQEIPPGTTASYSEIAAKIGKPKAVRAVASACAANKIAVLIPCHRVVRNDGAVSGYRWGIDRKAELIIHERVLKANNAT